MIRKARKATGDTAAPPARSRRERRLRKHEPLDVNLTVRLNFGAGDSDHVDVIHDRRIPMVGSVLANRDRILRGFLGLLMRTAFTQPRVARELFPMTRLLSRKSDDES
ncbi:MAG TPA: hypothetical protein VFV11_06950 [Solimonas sp.]|nr:hypothetical protein [Solimonas sp.]